MTTLTRDELQALADNPAVRPVQRERARAELERLEAETIDQQEEDYSLEFFLPLGATPARRPKPGEEKPIWPKALDDFIHPVIGTTPHLATLERLKALHARSKSLVVRRAVEDLLACFARCHDINAPEIANAAKAFLSSVVGA